MCFPWIASGENDRDSVFLQMALMDFGLVGLVPCWGGSLGLGETPRMCCTGGHFPKIYLEIEIFMRRSTKSSSREGGEDPRQQNRPTWVPLVCHMLPIYLKAVGDFGLRYFFAWGIAMEWSPPSKRLGLSQKSLFNLILLLVSVGNIIISWLFGER